MNRAIFATATLGIVTAFAVALGLLPLSIFATHVGPPLVAILGLFAFGCALLFAGRRAAAAWVAGRLTTAALLGTVVALVLGLLTANIGSADPAEAMVALLQTTGLAFFSTLLGLGGFIWLDWLLYLTKEDRTC